MMSKESALHIDNKKEKPKARFGIAYIVIIAVSIIFLFRISPVFIEANHRMLFGGGISILFGIFVLCCYYMPCKSIVFSVGRIFTAMAFFLFYRFGLKDETLLIVATLSFIIGAFFIIFGLFHYLPQQFVVI